MSDQEIRSLASAALDVIAATKPRYVHAARKGLVMGTRPHAGNFVFRRENGQIRFEKWFVGICGYQAYPLPQDLQDRAGKILDSL